VRTGAGGCARRGVVASWENSGKKNNRKENRKENNRKENDRLDNDGDLAFWDRGAPSARRRRGFMPAASPWD